MSDTRKLENDIHVINGNNMAPAMIPAITPQPTSSHSSQVIEGLFFAISASLLLILGCGGHITTCMATKQRELINELIEEAIKEYNSNGRKRGEPNSTDTPQKRKRRKYDRERAYKCIMHDYLGPYPLFDDRQFERVFRISRASAQVIMELSAATDPFFTLRKEGNGKNGIYPEVKVLTGLKVLAYGVSGSAFMDYFQMGESTARECVTKLTAVISSHPDLRAQFLRRMGPSDAKKVVELHRSVHGVSGMAGSLDCMHVPWKNCPVAYQGQYVGKEGEPTIVLEAACDYHLWFWSISFGHPGTLNDINVWDRSPLHASFIDGSWSKNDFEFTIDGTKFNQLFFLGEILTE